MLILKGELKKGKDKGAEQIRRNPDEKRSQNSLENTSGVFEYLANYPRRGINL